MSVLSDEIQFFNQLAREWWDLDGPQAMLHQLNPLRLRWITRYINLKGLNVLDVGCGGGILAESLARQGAVVTGLDLAEDLISMARHHAKVQNLTIQYHCADLMLFARQHEAQFDAVMCLEMLEHVEDFASILISISKVLKPGGKLFIATLDRTLRSFFEAIVGAEYVLKLVPPGTHHHSQFIRPDELCEAMRNTELEPLYIEGLRYHPLLKKFSLVPQPQTNYWLVGEKSL